MSRTSSVLLLAGILCLCCVSFVLGRRSAWTGGRVVYATHEMNELDRLQSETAKRQQ